MDRKLEIHLQIARKRALALAVTLDISLSMLEMAHYTRGSESMESSC